MNAKSTSLFSSLSFNHIGTIDYNVMDKSRSTGIFPGDTNMSVELSSFWLPILLSGIAVFIASSPIWTVVQYHNADWQKVPHEEAARQALGQDDKGHPRRIDSRAADGGHIRLVLALTFLSPVHLGSTGFAKKSRTRTDTASCK